MLHVHIIQNQLRSSIPTIVINLFKKRYVFNLIPNFTRFPRDYQFNVLNNSSVFFTKNHIDAMEGAVSFMTLLYAIESRNRQASNIVHFYGDQQFYDYFEQLKFKIGYKMLKFSYSTWERRSKPGLQSTDQIEKLIQNSNFPKIFNQINSYAVNLKLNLHNSRNYINDSSQYQDESIRIVPIFINDKGVSYTNYFCHPSILCKGVDTDFKYLENLYSHNLKKLLIEKQCTLENDKILKLKDYTIKSDCQLNSIAILHHSSIDSITELHLDPTFGENAKLNIELVVHIVEDHCLLTKSEFKYLMERFSQHTKHIFYNENIIKGDQLKQVQVNSSQLSFLSIKSYKSQFYRTMADYFENIFPKINQHSDHKAKESQIQSNNVNNELLKKYLIIPYNFSSYFRISKHQFQYTQNMALKLRSHNKVQVYLKNVIKIMSEQKKTLSDLSFQNYQQINKKQISIVFLGTSSFKRTEMRSTSCILLEMNHRMSIMLDCGEGSFQQFANHYPHQQFQNKLMSTRIIFITHIHHDHNLGILRFISQRQKLLKKIGKNQKLFLIIPFNIYPWYHSYCQTIENLDESCDVIFTQVVQEIDNKKNSNFERIMQSIEKEEQTYIKNVKKNPSKVFLKKNVCEQTEQDILIRQLSASSYNKKIISSHFSKQKQIVEQFISLMQKQDIKNFKPIRVIHCPQSFGVVIEGKDKKISYSGDTRPSKQFNEAALNSDFFIHEATFSCEEHELALISKHSTVLEATKSGFDSKSKTTILTHFNSNFWQQSSLNKSYFEKQNTLKYFQNNTIFAVDHMIINENNASQATKVSHFLDQIFRQRFRRQEKIL